MVYILVEIFEAKVVDEGDEADEGIYMQLNWFNTNLLKHCI